MFKPSVVIKFDLRLSKKKERKRERIRKRKKKKKKKKEMLITIIIGYTRWKEKKRNEKVSYLKTRRDLFALSPALSLLHPEFPIELSYNHSI